MRTMTTSSSSSVKPLARPARDFSCSLSVPPGPWGPRNINAGLQASASFEITSTTRRTTGGFPPPATSRRPLGRHNGPVLRQRHCTIPRHQNLYLGTKTGADLPPGSPRSSWARAGGGAGDSPVGSGRLRPYGTSPPPSILPNSLLIFDVEVVREGRRTGPGPSVIRVPASPGPPQAAHSWPRQGGRHSRPWTRNAGGRQGSISGSSP